MPVLTGQRRHLRLVAPHPQPPVKPRPFIDLQPGDTAWTALHPEFGAVTHVLAACPDLQASLAAVAHPWAPDSPANGWLCTECLDLDSTSRPQVPTVNGPGA